MSQSNCGRPMSSRLRNAFAGTFFFLCLLWGGTVGAQTLWLENPVDGDWGNANNWNPATVPNSHGAQVEFGLTSIPLVSLSATTYVGAITFAADANAYTINAAGNLLAVIGDGISNLSSETQTFVFNNGAAFFGTANAGDHTMTYRIEGHTLQFQSNSSAGDAVYRIMNGGGVQFVHDSTSGDSQFILEGGKLVNHKDDDPLTIGSLEGLGVVHFANQPAGGPEQTLRVGSLNTDTTFSGTIQDDNEDITGTFEKIGTGTLTLTGTTNYKGGTIISGGTLQIGDGGTTGTLAGDVENNGFLIFNRSNDFAFGGDITGTGGLGKLGEGRMEYTGTNTGDLGTFIDAGTLAVSGTINHPGGNLVVANGADSDGTLEISGGGSVTTGTGFVGFGDGSTGMAIVSDGTWTNAAGLVVGAFGEGTLEISGTGVVSSDGGILGSTEDSNGIVRVSGGSWTNSGVLAIGESGTGLLEVSGTGEVSNTLGVLGWESDSSGTATISGSTWTNTSGLIIGDEGEGIVNLTGGTLNAPMIDLASKAGSTGTLNIGTGSTAGTLNADSISGGDGTATVNFNHTGTVSFDPLLEGSLSVNQLGDGTTILSGDNTYTGGTTITGGTLQIGNGGTSGSILGNVTNNAEIVFNVNDDYSFGGVVSGTGDFTQSAGILRLTSAQTYTGATTINDGAVLVLPFMVNQGLSSETTVHVESGGFLDISNSELTIAGLTGSGTVYSFIDGNAPVGNLTLNIASGTATFDGVLGESSPHLHPNFNLTKDGDGTQILTGNNNFNGDTTVSAGELQLLGSLGNTTLTVQDGARFSGNGTTAGEVIIENGGTLAPGTSPGTLTMGSLTLNDASILEFELGNPGPSDFIQVNGDLTLNGILNLTALSGFGAGDYQLFGYTGGLTDNGLLFGNVPGLFDLTVDVGTANEVNLLVEAATAQYWDGSNTVPNGVINGGTGTWNDTTTNWTNSGGNANAAWVGGLVAAFGGSSGTVTLADGFTADASGYDFQVGGYTLAASGSGAINITGDTPFVTEIGTTTINAPITGDGVLDAQGDGALRLNAANTYTGGTILSEGTLVLGHNNALGTGTLTIRDGTTLATPSSFLPFTTRTIGNDIVVEGDFSVLPQGQLILLSSLQLNGDIDLTGGTRTITNLTETGPLYMGGVISNGGLTLEADPFNSSAYFRFNGSEANTYTGDTTVGEYATLTLAKDNNVTSIAGDLIIEDFGTVITSTSEQIADTSNVHMIEESTLRIGLASNATETIGSLTDDGSGWAWIELRSSLLNFSGSTLRIGEGEFTGDIVGGGIFTTSIEKYGPGTLVLSGFNDYRGDTLISGGVLSVSADESLGSQGGLITSPSALILDGGTLRATDSFITERDTILGAGDGGFEITGANVLIHEGEITGIGALNFSGTGTLALMNGNNDYTGGTSIEGGTLFIGATGATGDGTITVLGSTITYADGVVENNPIDLQSNVNLEVLGTDNARQNGPIFEIGGSYGITKIGEGTLRLTGANTFTGRTLVNEGVLTLRNGGSIDSNDAVIIGQNEFDFGTMRVNGSGAGANLTTQDRLVVGREGMGRLRVTNGGEVVADSVRIGAQLSGLGEVLVTGSGSQLTSQSVLNVGQQGSGYLEVLDGGEVSAVDMFVGRQFASLGTVFLDDADTRLNLSGDLMVGNRGFGDVFVVGGSGISQDGAAVVGRFFDGDGAVFVAETNSFWEIGGLLTLGDRGLGSLDILEGGRVEAHALALGFEFDGDGLLGITDSGSILDLSGPSVIGAEGIGAMFVENSATVQQTGGASIAWGVDSEGLVIVEESGSTWNIGGNLLVAGSGFGVLRILDGGFVSSDYTEIGQGVDGFGRVNINGIGSILEQRGAEIQVGVDGFGRLNVRNGGRVDQSGFAGPMQVAVNAGSEGRVVIGSAGGGSPAAPGILDVAGIHGGGGDARLVFRHDSDGYFFTRNASPEGAPIIISGSTSVRQLAGGTVLTGANTYTGGTIINGGNLGTANPSALGMGPVNLNDGRLTVLQILNIGDNFTWTGGDIFAQLGTDTTRIDVDGSLDLTAPGTFEFTPDAGFQNKIDYLILTTLTDLPYDPASDFVGNNLFGLSPQFKIIGGELYVTYPGSFIANGPVLQNSAPVGTPFFADFIVGPGTRTGTNSENNIIRSLTFQPNGSLQVFNTLQVTDGLFRVDEGTGTLNGGTIFVPGNFSKTGNGTLVFNSDANVQGEANVNAGSLLINGAFFAGGGFSIQPGALLGGTGILTGNVFNNGTVAPGNSIGTLTINGDYTQTPDATLAMEMRSPSVTDRLFITGKAFLSGTLAVNVMGNQMSFGDVVRILTAEGGINGGFDRITGAPSGFRIRPWMLNGGTTYNLIFAPQSYTQVAQGENQINLARALDQWIGVSERSIFDATLQLDLLRAEQYGAVFEAILPTIYSSLGSTVFTDSYGDGRTVNQQALFARRLVQPSANANGENGEDTARSDEEGLPTRDSNQWRVWADARGIYADSDPLSLNSEGGTILAGADLRLRNNLIGGLYVGGQSRKSRGSDPDYETDGPRFGVYGLLGFAENAYLSGVIGGGTSSTSVTRPIAFGGSASGDMDGYDWFTRLEAGYTFHTGGFRLTPFLGIQYSQAHFDGFTENSDSVFALAFDDWSVDRFEGFVGVDLSRPFVISEKYQLIPYGRLALRDTFNQKGSSLDARLNRGEGPSFRFNADDPDEDGVEYGGGIRLTTMEHSWSLNLGYTGFSGNETNFNQVNIGFSLDL